jgi:hypothetical protein
MDSETNEQPEANGPVTPPNSAENGNSAAQEDFVESLARGLEKHRLTPELKAEIFADMPPPEEQERLYRELMEQGGLSSEEFLASLDLLAEDETLP